MVACMDSLCTWDILFCTQLELLHSFVFFIFKTDLPLINNCFRSGFPFHNLLSSLWSTFHYNICNKLNSIAHWNLLWNIQSPFKLYLSFYGSCSSSQSLIQLMFFLLSICGEWVLISHLEERSNLLPNSWSWIFDIFLYMYQ